MNCEQGQIRGVLDWFLAMCEFPHGSWNEAELVNFMESELKKRGWAVMRDEFGNLRADIPAVPGKENCPLVIVQGHLDMVCARKDSSWDPGRDTVCAFVENGVLKTDGRSSLGADNNLGNAAALYLLDQNFVHGPIRLLLTVAEEVGLQGASLVNPGWLEGARYLLNTDGFKLGRATIASASGRREVFSREISYTPAGLTSGWKISVKGSMGGHSGDDINRGRANCICLMALFLEELRGKLDYELAELGGGHALNAIPLEAHARIHTSTEAECDVQAAAECFNRRIRSVYGRCDPNVELCVEQADCLSEVWAADDRDRVLNLVGLLHNGVFAMHDTIPNLVAASSNTGIVAVRDGNLEVVNYTRSAWEFAEEMICCRHKRAAKLTGFSWESQGYPSWNGNADSALVRAMSRIFREITGDEMEIAGVHVGLEPAVLGAMNPEMEMVVTGPDILDPHSVNERAPVEGLPVYVKLLQNTLEWIAAQ